MPEGAFSRRAPGQNPIALELTRLAESQTGPQVLGQAPRPSAQPMVGQPAPTPPKEKFRSLLGQLALHDQGQRQGVLSQVSDAELQSAVLGAHDALSAAVRSGRATVDATGNVQISDPNDKGEDVKGGLDVIGEYQRRQGMDDVMTSSPDYQAQQTYLKDKAGPVMDRLLNQGP